MSSIDASMEQQMRLTRTHDTNQRCICEFYSPSYSLFVLAAFLLPVFFTAAKKKIKLELTFIHSINCDHEKVQFDILYLCSTYNHHQNCPAMVRHDHLGLVRAIVHSAVFRLDFCPPPLSLYVQCLQMSTLSASSMTLPSSLIDSQ